MNNVDTEKETAIAILNRWRDFTRLYGAKQSTPNI